MIINDGAPVYEHFYSDFVDIMNAQKHSNHDTSYTLHVYDSTVTHIYCPNTDNDIICNHFLANVLRQIHSDGVAIVLVTDDFGKGVYIIASDE